MEEFEREVELIDYIEVLLKRKWFILLATLACMGGGVLYNLIIPALYQASTLLFVAYGAGQPNGRVTERCRRPTGLAPVGPRLAPAGYGRVPRQFRG